MTNVRVTDASGHERVENFVVRYSSVRVIRLGVTELLELLKTRHMMHNILLLYFVDTLLT